MDEVDFHMPVNVSWQMLKQWFKSLLSKLITINDHMGRDLDDMIAPPNFEHHTLAGIEYLEQLRKVQREIAKAIMLSHGTYCDQDSIKLKASPKSFIKPEGPYTFEYGRKASTISSKPSTSRDPAASGGISSVHCASSEVCE